MPWLRLVALQVGVLVVLSGCGGDGSAAENDPIDPHDVMAATEIEVFGVHVASNDAPNGELETVTEMLRGLLDADGNERADAPLVEAELTGDAVTVLVTLSDRFISEYDPASATLVLGGVASADRMKTMRHIDALIYRHGWSKVFDSLYGIRVGSDLAYAMDQARGGQFDEVPETYPAHAWYTQSREGCAYRCQLIEYFFHVHMTLLGEYEDDEACLALLGVWRTCTPEALNARDPLAYRALTAREAGLVDVAP